MLSMAARSTVTLGTTFVLARILSPRDFGLVAMVMSLTAVFEILSDMGLSWATVQKKNLSEAEVSNLFWLNAALGGGLALSCIVLAPVLERLYGQPEVAAIARALGVCYLV
jgi:PST family polysaccharide transporter